jgi:hypothetical protein
MAGRTTFAKLQREKAKKAKAEAKRQARSTGDAPPPVEEPTPQPVQQGPSTKPPSPQELLILVERLQSDYDNGRISEDEYEEQKMLLFERVNAG